MSTVLVTGGAGYIGSHTVVELLAQGYGVVVADNFSNSRPEALTGLHQVVGSDFAFEQVDLSDPEACKSCFDRHPDIDAVIHFAASKAVGESVENPLLYYRNNLGSLICLLSEMKERRIRHLVFSSSCTVYGQPAHLPVDERAPRLPAESPYGQTKQISEDILKDCASAYGMTVIALRYFNPIGAHESALIGEFPLGVPSNLMPFITQTAAGIRECLSVFGNDYPTPDGTCIRDYIHVMDLASAHVAALARLEEQVPFEVFNIGTGKGYSVLEVIQSFEKMSGEKLRTRFVDRRAGDIVQIWAEASLAEKELHWKAQRSLDDMTLSAWKWQQHLATLK